MEQVAPYKPKNKIRIVTAASLFDGHDAAINIMRRIIQSTGVDPNDSKWLQMAPNGSKWLQMAPMGSTWLWLRQMDMAMAQHCPKWS